MNEILFLHWDGQQPTHLFFSAHPENELHKGGSQFINSRQLNPIPECTVRQFSLIMSRRQASP